MSDARCPQCGAPAARSEEDAFASCRFCGARLRLALEPGVRHEALAPAIRADEVPVRLKTWLSSREALGKADGVTSRLLFHPFWVHESAAGAEIVAAAPLLSEGLAAFRLPSGDRKAFGDETSRQGEVVAANVSREALSFATAPLAEVRLVHVPFWDVSFQLFGRPGRVLIDAVSGQALPLSSLPTSESRLDHAYALLLVALFVIAFVGFRWLFRGVPAKGLALLLGAGPALLFTARLLIVKMEET